MTPFEYILPLVSVISGLAITDTLVSFHKLLRARDKVKWDWMPLATALLAILSVLETWWRFYSLQNEIFFHSLGGFLPLMFQLILLYLLNAASLPDVVKETPVSLRDFYIQNRKYFWSIFSLYVFITATINLVSFFLKNGVEFQRLVVSIIILFAFISLVFTTNRKIHAAIILAFSVIFIYEWWTITLF